MNDKTGKTNKSENPLIRMRGMTSRRDRVVILETVECAYCGEHFTRKSDRTDLVYCSSTCQRSDACHVVHTPLGSTTNH